MASDGTKARMICHLNSAQFNWAMQTLGERECSLLHNYTVYYNIIRMYTPTAHASEHGSIYMSVDVYVYTICA